MYADTARSSTLNRIAQPDTFHELEAIPFPVKKTNSPILAYWLLPAEPFAAYLTILI
jgi:hypothetical protein